MYKTDKPSSRNLYLTDACIIFRLIKKNRRWPVKGYLRFFHYRIAMSLKYGHYQDIITICGLEAFKHLRVRLWIFSLLYFYAVSISFSASSEARGRPQINP